jgi:hypothetical protein
MMNLKQVKHLGHWNLQNGSAGLSNLDDDLAKLIHGDDVKPWLEEELA